MGNKCKLCSGNNGDAPCAYPEARKCLKVQQEINELAAHIGSIQSAIIKRIDVLSKKLASAKENNDLELESFFDGRLRETQYWNNEANSLPPQSLNHIKAQVEEETIEHFCNYVAHELGLDLTREDVANYERKYSNQPETAAKDGE